MLICLISKKFSFSGLYFAKEGPKPCSKIYYFFRPQSGTCCLLAYNKPLNNENETFTFFQNIQYGDRRKTSVGWAFCVRLEPTEKEYHGQKWLSHVNRMKDMMHEDLNGHQTTRQIQS